MQLGRPTEALPRLFLIQNSGPVKNSKNKIETRYFEFSKSNSRGKGVWKVERTQNHANGGYCRPHPDTHHLLYFSSDSKACFGCRSGSCLPWQRFLRVRLVSSNLVFAPLANCQEWHESVTFTSVERRQKRVWNGWWGVRTETGKLLPNFARYWRFPSSHFDDRHNSGHSFPVHFHHLSNLCLIILSLSTRMDGKIKAGNTERSWKKHQKRTRDQRLWKTFANWLRHSGTEIYIWSSLKMCVGFDANGFHNLLLIKEHGYVWTEAGGQLQLLSVDQSSVAVSDLYF